MKKYAGAALVALIGAGLVAQAQDAVVLRSSDTQTEQPRLTVTTSVLNGLAEVRVEQARLRLGTDAILQLGTATPASPAAGDVRYASGSVLYWDGAAWQTLVTASGTSGTYILNGTASQSASFNITGSGTLGTNLTVNGNTTLGNATADTITLTGRLASSLVPGTTTTYDLGASTLRWRSLYGLDGDFTGSVGVGGDARFGDAATDSVYFTARVATSLSPSVDLTHSLGLSTSRWSAVYGHTADFSGDGQIAGSWLVKSGTTLGDAVSDTISFVGRANTALVPNTSATHDLGSSTLRWNDGWFAGKVYGEWTGSTIRTGMGGTGLTTFTGAYRLLYSTDASTLATLAPAPGAGYYLRSDGFAPYWATVASGGGGTDDYMDITVRQWIYMGVHGNPDVLDIGFRKIPVCLAGPGDVFVSDEGGFALRWESTGEYGALTVINTGAEGLDAGIVMDPEELFPVDEPEYPDPTYPANPDWPDPYRHRHFNGVAELGPGESLRIPRDGEEPRLMPAAHWQVTAVTGIDGTCGPGFTFQGVSVGTRLRGIITYWIRDTTAAPGNK